MHEYDQIADWYCSVRNPSVGIAEVTALVNRLMPGARILDLGCGDGNPISRFLIGKRCRVVGLDSASEMIARYRTHFPSTPAQCLRVQDAQFQAGSFDAVVAWGMLFHLSAAEQAEVLASVAKWLAPGGVFLFTSGDAEEIAESTMDGVRFRYVSLGSRRYREVLETAGMHIVEEHADEWENYVYLAEKAA
ncbi:MAG: class I SAM-dependent methyltransferase [Vicinamibacterales bacterium]